MTPSDDDVDTIVRGLLYGATGREEVAQETITLGAALSTLDAAEAAAFAVACDGYCKIARQQAGETQEKDTSK